MCPVKQVGRVKSCPAEHLWQNHLPLIAPLPSYMPWSALHLVPQKVFHTETHSLRPPSWGCSAASAITYLAQLKFSVSIKWQLQAWVANLQALQKAVKLLTSLPEPSIVQWRGVTLLERSRQIWFLLPISRRGWSNLPPREWGVYLVLQWTAFTKLNVFCK